MCKHVAAALYGVGARLDHEPEMLFTLRGVEPAEMIAAAITDVRRRERTGARILSSDDVSSVFGIELDLRAAATGDQATGPVQRTAKKSTKARAPGSRAKKKKPGTTRVGATKKQVTKPAGKVGATKKQVTEPVGKNGSTKKTSRRRSSRATRPG